MENSLAQQYKLDKTKFLDHVHVFAPATVANMVCGYDILGFAVNEPGDEVIMKKTKELGITILSITGDEGKLPLDPMKNTVSHSAWKLFCDLGLNDSFGLSIELHKKMPIGSGLGSSAASTVAGIFALNELLGKPLSKDQLLPYCMEGERLACGSAHADNVAPSLFGGITLIPSHEPLIVRSLPVPEELYVALVYPKVDVPTKEARQLIKNKVPLQKAVKQWGNIASLIAAIYENDYDEIGRSMQDEIIEPHRSLLIPFFDEMKEIALKNNALTFGISGSGPTVMALTNSKLIAENIATEIEQFLNEKSIEHFSYVSKINQQGPYLKIITMKLYSTNNSENLVSFKEAVFQSLPKDNGLYMPQSITPLDEEWLNTIEKYSFTEIAQKVSYELLKDDFSEDEIHQIVTEVVSFPAPLQFLEKDLAVLELFHGPSFAFKDFGARFMSRVMAHFSKKDDQLLDVLVATSGDTGGAVALGFLDVEGTRVTILYPKGKVSPIQELQLTANGKNIRAIEIDGTFDDCQHLVKQAFLDEELQSSLNLTSANSINIARLIPQSFYYFEAFAQAKRQGFENISFIVPSGNFGNITAGILASKLGLKIEKFIAATNANDTVPAFLKTNIYQPKPSVQTLSNAMDVGNPSNWTRLMAFFNNDVNLLKEKINSSSFSDKETEKAIEKINDDYNYIACPHTAIAWLAAKDYQKEKLNENEAVIFLSTAHPCKFPEVFSEKIRSKITDPDSVKELKNKPSNKVEMDYDFNVLKNWLITNK